MQLATSCAKDWSLRSSISRAQLTVIREKSIIAVLRCGDHSCKAMGEHHTCKSVYDSGRKNGILTFQDVVDLL